jgi:hypothetical protein
VAIKVTLLKDGNDIFGGRNRIQHASIDLDNSYPTGGYVLPATYFFGGQAKAANIWNVLFGDAGTTGGGAYRFYYDIPNGKLMVYWATPAGTIAFTGTVPTADLNLATPVFSGTGYATAGQVITTTDNQTMTLNQCAGMWFVPSAGAKPAVIILSNTAVAGAPAVLTVQGVAPTTDAGAYKIVTGQTPVGTAALTGTAAALTQVTNGTNLSAVVGLRMTIFGR